MQRILQVFVDYIFDLVHEMDTAITTRYISLPETIQIVSN